MARSLERHLGERVRFSEARGGFFHWVRLGGGRDAEALLARARARGVAFLPGSRFSSRGGQRDCLRLSFSYYEEERIEEGIARLAAALGD